MIFDTHAHCYWESLLPRIDEIILNMDASEVVRSVQIGCDIETSEKAIALAKKYPSRFFATVGHHPETAQDISDFAQIEQYESLILENREIIVALGETGFDYHYLTPGREELQKKNQQAWWIMQWELACKYNLPLVIHTRDAREDTLSFMRGNDIDRCVMHCFSEDWDFAEELLDFSPEIYFSFSGILTYKNAPKIQEVARKIPLDRILIETDAPFLSPQAVRGTINEPANTKYVLEKLTELRSESGEEIERGVYENSLRFYGIAGETLSPKEYR